MHEDPLAPARGIVLALCLTPTAVAVVLAVVYGWPFTLPAVLGIVVVCRLVWT